jgi:thiamine pyrophosphate-dependent acetolactate synthase large subunit-like protein
VVIDKAIAIALDDPPGPVHVDLPINVAASQQIDQHLVGRDKEATSG